PAGGPAVGVEPRSAARGLAAPALPDGTPARRSGPGPTARRPAGGCPGRGPRPVGRAAARSRGGPPGSLGRGAAPAPPAPLRRGGTVRATRLPAVVARHNGHRGGLLLPAPAAAAGGPGRRER